LAWLGDGYADDGSFNWQGQAVDFNCITWGYDCGDLANAPSDDPYGVCNGDLPPQNGCDSPLSTSQFSTLDVSIYPNPFSELLTLDLGALRDARVVVLDLQGRIMIDQQMSGINQIETAPLVKGVYQVVILQDEGQAVQTIVKY